MNKHETDMNNARSAVITHAEAVGGKPFADISYNQMRVMDGFNGSLEGRANLNRLLQAKLHDEQAGAAKGLFMSRIARWVSAGRPADQVTKLAQGEFGLVKDGG